MNPKAWLLIQNAYTGFECTAFVNGIYGPWFLPRRGVHQGAPASMILYTVVTNGLLKKLCSNPNGICVRNLMLSSPTHADDIAILSLQKTGLNSMFLTSYEYGRKWRSSFNTDKTVFLCWGEDRSPHIPVIFGNETLQPKDEGKHMGVTLTTSTDRRKTNEIVHKRIGSGKHALLSGLGVGSVGVRTSPNTMSRIYSQPRLIRSLWAALKTSNYAIFELHISLMSR